MAVWRARGWYGARVYGGNFDDSGIHGGGIHGGGIHGGCIHGGDLHSGSLHVWRCNKGGALPIPPGPSAGIAGMALAVALLEGATPKTVASLATGGASQEAVQSLQAWVRKAAREVRCWRLGIWGVVC